LLKQQLLSVTLCFNPLWIFLALRNSLDEQAAGFVTGTIVIAG